jgi:hypothetical protein
VVTMRAYTKGSSRVLTPRTSWASRPTTHWVNHSEVVDCRWLRSGNQLSVEWRLFFARNHEQLIAGAATLAVENSSGRKHDVPH